MTLLLLLLEAAAAAAAAANIFEADSVLGEQGALCGPVATIGGRQALMPPLPPAPAPTVKLSGELSAAAAAAEALIPAANP